MVALTPGGMERGAGALRTRASLLLAVIQQSCAWSQVEWVGIDEHSMPLLVGTKLGPYEIVGPLGKGASGAVRCR